MNGKLNAPVVDAYFRTEKLYEQVVVIPSKCELVKGKCPLSDN